MAGGVMPIAMLQGKVDSNNALVVSLGGGGFGSDTQVLFNDGGTIAGDAGLVFDKTTDVLTVAGQVQAVSFAFTTGPDTDTGMFRDGANWVSLRTNGVTNFSVDTALVNAVLPFAADVSVRSPILYGSNAANGDLVIEGTSNATKTTSDVSIQPTGGTISTGGTACVASFGPAVVVSITIKNGLVVAIS